MASRGFWVVLFTIVINAANSHPVETKTALLRSQSSSFSLSWSGTQHPRPCDKPCVHFSLVSFLTKYSSKHGPYFNQNVVAVEHRFDFMIDNYAFGAIIDRIDEVDNLKFNILDYKTGKKKLTEKKILMDLQMGIYYLGFKSEHPNFKEINLMHYYLIPGEEVEKKIPNKNLINAKSNKSILTKENNKKGAEAPFLKTKL